MYHVSGQPLVTDWRQDYPAATERIVEVRRVFDDARIDAVGCASLLELTSADAVVRRSTRLMARNFPLADIDAALTRWHELYPQAVPA